MFQMKQFGDGRAIPTIPKGFVLCDGTNGTLDLRDKFIVGAAKAYVPGATGGANTHAHTIDADAHKHSRNIWQPLKSGGAVMFDKDTNEVIITGTAVAESNVPEFYALLYIQRAG